MEGIKQRIEVEYTRKEKLSIARKLQILSLQIEDKSDDGINTIFDNQDKCGLEICKVFKNKSIINCLVYGMTQTGKTGCMTSLIQHYCLSELIPINNIYIITGLSDTEWKKDTKNRMPDSINSQVFHRANLSKTFMKDIREKQNTLIIMDEIQIACEENQTIHKTFIDCGFYDLDFLLENDIKLIQFSATPDGNMNDVLDWKYYSAKVKLDPGYGHYGANQAIEQNRVKQFLDLTNIDNVRELKQDIETTFTNPRYHLARIPNKRENKDGTNNQSKVISNIKKVFGKNYEYNKNYLKAKKGDINDILKKQPEKGTFIFYCEILRCAKTQYKKYIGISYERFVDNPNDSSIIQGTFGRDTGYDNNGDSICYTNIPSLENYIKLWDNDMEFKKGIKWNTKTTQYNEKDDLTYSTGTFNSVKHIEQLKDNCSEKVKDIDRGEPILGGPYQTFERTVKEGRVLNVIKRRSPKKPGEDKLKDGYYVVNISGKTRILSQDKLVETSRVTSGMGKSKYCIRPCYSDLNDPNTLEWWLIYYE